MYQKHTGIILKKFPINEADELLTLYSRDRGKMRVKAVSSRKLRSRLGGYLQTLNEIEFETASGKRRGSAIPVLISARLSVLNNYLRGDLKKFAWALQGAETLYRLTPDFEASHAIYDMTIDFLKQLGITRNEEDSLWVRQFQLRLLQMLGYGFDLKRSDLGQKELSQLRALLSGERIESLFSQTERVIEGYIEEVMERELRSKKFINLLTA